MAIKTEIKGHNAQPVHIYSDAVIDVSSVDPANPDVLIPWTRVAPGGKINIGVRETNGKEVRIQPWGVFHTVLILAFFVPGIPKPAAPCFQPLSSKLGLIQSSAGLVVV